MNTRRRVVGLCLAFGIVLTATLMATAEPKSSGGSPRPYKPVQSTERMMLTQKKVMGDLKAAIGEKSWDEAETCAWILAESANSNHYQRDDASYQKFADRMSAQCVELATTLKKHDEAAAKEQINGIGKTCGACHDQFQEKKGH